MTSSHTNQRVLATCLLCVRIVYFYSSSLDVCLFVCLFVASDMFPQLACLTVFFIGSSMFRSRHENSQLADRQTGRKEIQISDSEFEQRNGFHCHLLALVTSGHTVRTSLGARHKSYI